MIGLKNIPKISHLPSGKVMMRSKYPTKKISLSSSYHMTNHFSKNSLSSFASMRFISSSNNINNNNNVEKASPSIENNNQPIHSNVNSPVDPGNTGNSLASELQSTLEELANDPITAKVKTEGEYPNFLSPLFDAIGIHPVTWTQDLFLAIHEMTGLPWWLEIIGITVLSRLAFISLFANNLKVGVKMANLAPQAREIQVKMQKATDVVAKMKIREELIALWKEHGVSPMQPLKNGLKQMPVFLLCFLSLRDPTFSPSMAYEGAAWFPNLMLTDKTYLLPILNSLGFVASIELGADNPSASKNKNLTRGLAGIGSLFLLYISQNFPAAVLIYWAAQSWVGVGISLALKKTRLREYFNIPHFVNHDAPAPIIKPQSVSVQKPQISYSEPIQVEKPQEKVEPKPSAPQPQFYSTPPVPQGQGKKNQKNQKKQGRR